MEASRDETPIGANQRCLRVGVFFSSTRSLLTFFFSFLSFPFLLFSSLLSLSLILSSHPLPFHSAFSLFFHHPFFSIFHSFDPIPIPTTHQQQSAKHTQWTESTRVSTTSSSSSARARRSSKAPLQRRPLSQRRPQEVSSPGLPSAPPEKSGLPSPTRPMLVPPKQRKARFSQPHSGQRQPPSQRSSQLDTSPSQSLLSNCSPPTTKLGGPRKQWVQSLPNLFVWWPPRHPRLRVITCP